MRNVNRVSPRKTWPAPKDTVRGGPNGNELDVLEWRTKEGLLAWARRDSELGHFCGYVVTPEAITVVPDDVFVVHGGLTGGFRDEDGLWSGFDCSHLGDRRYEPHLKAWAPSDAGTYRDLEFVMVECERLARQFVDPTMQDLAREFGALTAKLAAKREAMEELCTQLADR